MVMDASQVGHVQLKSQNKKAPRSELNTEKGTENPADFMSRHPVSLKTDYSTRASKVDREYANFMALQAMLKAMTAEEIKTEKKRMSR